MQFRWLNAVNATFVENVTAVKGEEEMIFPTGTEFLITKVIPPENTDTGFCEIHITIAFAVY